MTADAILLFVAALERVLRLQDKGEREIEGREGGREGERGCKIREREAAR